MQFKQIHVGGSGVAFPASHMQVEEFHFPQSAAQASAVLQGFELAHAEGDIDLRSIGIELITHFAAGDSGGSVEVRFHLQDDSGGGILSSNLITAEIFILVIGT
jgi:hypothetical protein